MKWFLKCAVPGVGIGAAFLIVQWVFKIPDDTLMDYYWAFSVIVIAGTVFRNHLYIRKYRKKMKNAAILLEAGKAGEYIEVVGRLRQNAKGRYLENLFTVNLSAGYCDLNQYEKAAELLESILDAHLYGNLKMVCRLNLCCCYFSSGQLEKGMALYESAQKEFRLFRKSKTYGGNIAVLDVFAAIKKGELTHAHELLKAAGDIWDTPRLKREYGYLEELLQLEQPERIGIPLTSYGQR